MLDSKYKTPEVKEIQEKYGISEEDLEYFVGAVADVITESYDYLDTGMDDTYFDNILQSL